MKVVERVAELQSEQQAGRGRRIKVSLNVWLLVEPGWAAVRRVSPTATDLLPFSSHGLTENEIIGETSRMCSRVKVHSRCSLWLLVNRFYIGFTRLLCSMDVHISISMPLHLAHNFITLCE